MAAKPHRSWLGRIVRRLLMLVVGFYVVTIGLLVLYRFVPPPITGVQVQRWVGAQIAREPFSFRRQWVSLDALPAAVPHAIVASEDTRFYEHHGFDLQEQAKADATAPKRKLGRRGASTITQQLVKNLFFTTHRSYVRKALEITLTPVAEFVLGKRRILELYVNEIEWGPRGVFGVEAASQFWYQTRAAKLGRDQAIRLAGLVPAPRRRTPASVGWYVPIVAERMSQMGW
jgi:monofunctional biosynthetic peptidoglycan transglycosylase